MGTNIPSKLQIPELKSVASMTLHSHISNQPPKPPRVQNDWWDLIR